MKVLVSGGTGLVGRYVVDGLLGAGHEVTLGGRPPSISPLAGEMSAKLTEGGDNRTFGSRRVRGTTPLTLDPTLDQREQFADIDVFIHLAFDHLPGRYRGGEGDDPARFRRLNHEGSVKLFEDAKAAGVRRCIFLSSRAVYDGLPPGTVLTEDMALSPDSLYGRIKLESEQALGNLSSSTFITTSLRATGVYGHHRPNKWDGLFEDFRAGKPVTPRAGSEVHGDDLAAAILLAMEQDASVVNGKAFNISDIVTDTHEILSIHARETGASHPLPAQADHASLNVMDTTRLKALGWQPSGRARLEQTLRALAQKNGFVQR